MCEFFFFEKEKKSISIERTIEVVGRILIKASQGRDGPQVWHHS
jgi:hypothetical protein